MSGYDVVVCTTCGFGYADGVPEQREFDRYYREMSKYEYHQRGGAESEYDRARLALVGDIIAAHIRSHASHILDLGCASGRLLSHLRNMGFDSLTGIDISPACAEAASRLYGVRVKNTSLEDLGREPERYDVVLLVGVLEHVRDVNTFLGHLRTILTPGGLVYVEVPDATAFAEWPNAPFQDFSTEHINFFAPISLTNLMRRQGFSPQWLERSHRIQSYRTIMSNISAVFHEASLSSSSFTIDFDSDTEAGLVRYISRSRADDEVLKAKIDILAASQRPILVWGVGTHTTRLLTASRLGEANIVAFIESNVRYHGRSLSGRPILAPEALRAHAEPVLVSSRVFQQEIVEQIRHGLGCRNELILLYDF